MIKSLKTRQICVFFIAFMPVTKFFMMPSVAAKIAGRDAWISCVFNIAIDFAALLFMLKASKNANTDFFGLCEKSLGKIGSRVFYALFAAYFLLKAYVPISEQRDYVELTLYSALPTVLDFMPFILLAFYLSQNKLRIIGRISDAVWIFAVCAYILLFALSVTNADFSSLLPIGKTPIKKIAKGSFSSLNWYGDAAYFVFFIGRFEHKKGDTLKIAASYLLSALAVLGFITLFYSVFSSIAFRQRYALTEMAKYSTVINNVGRFDYFSIFFLLFASAFSMSLPLYFACRLITRAIPVKHTKLVSVSLFAIYATLLIIFKEYNASMETFVETYGGYIFLFFGNVVPILVSLLCLKEEKKIETLKN